MGGPEIKEDLMSLRVNTNVEAFNAHRNLQNTSMALSKSMEKLSSGLRINRAADDAAGLAISEGMRAQIRGTAQASRNAQDGISLVQTAEGSLNEMHSILQRIRELAVQWSNGTLSTADQAKINSEVAQLTAELVRIRDSSTFNGIALFGASAPTIVTLQVGANGNIDAANNTNRIGVTLVALSFTTVSMDVSQIDTAISSVSQARSDLGAVQNRLEHAVANLGVYEENLSASESRIRDVDVASEMVNFTRLQILSQSGTAMLAQANQSNQGVLSLLRG
jgi:flagellin